MSEEIIWTIYEFTRGNPISPHRYREIGEAYAAHSPGAWASAARLFPALGRASAGYPNGRLVVRPKGDLRGMRGAKLTPARIAELRALAKDVQALYPQGFGVDYHPDHPKCEVTYVTTEDGVYGATEVCTLFNSDAENEALARFWAALSPSTVLDLLDEAER